MKKRELTQYREKTTEELAKKIEELKNGKISSFVKRVTGEEKNTKAVKAIKKDIAQLMTILNEKTKKEVK